MAILKIEVCDICKNRDGHIKKFRISTEERRVYVALCEEHATPLEHIIETARPSKRVTNHPTDMSEVAALKKTSAHKRAPRTKRTR